MQEWILLLSNNIEFKFRRDDWFYIKEAFLTISISNMLGQAMFNNMSLQISLKEFIKGNSWICVSSPNCTSLFSLFVSHYLSRFIYNVHFMELSRRQTPGQKEEALCKPDSNQPTQWNLCDLTRCFVWVYMYNETLFGL